MAAVAIDTRSLLDTNVAKHAVHQGYDPNQRESTNVPFSETLLKQLTLEEKVNLLSGANFVSSAGVDRLNVPALKVSSRSRSINSHGFEYTDEDSSCRWSTR